MEESVSKDESLIPKDRRKLFIGILVTLLLVSIFFIYQYYRLSAKNEQQAQELSSTFLQLDSISNELDQRILTIRELGGEVDTLMKIREQLEMEKIELLTRQDNQQKLINTLRGKVDGYQELLVMKDEEIKQLKIINDQLLSENSTLKTEKQELNQSIRQINEAKTELEEKVAFASRLKVESLKVVAVNESGREREDEFRNRHIKQLKITFTIGKNEVAPIEGKSLLIRVVAPDGNVLFDVTRGSGTFMFSGREMFYTAKQDILYDRKSQLVTLFYEKGSDFSLGSHKIEVYTDDYLMGSGSFIVK